MTGAPPSRGQDAVDEGLDLLLGAGQQLYPVVASGEQQDLLVTACRSAMRRVTPPGAYMSFSVPMSSTGPG
jgi:hypothetical protein